MEPFNGTLTSETNTVTSTSTTTVTTTAVATASSTTGTTATNSSVGNGGVQGAEDDSNFDRLTQMLPECFVSVKLENNEDTCATEASANTVSSVQDSTPQDIPSECSAETSRSSLPEMQSSQQTSQSAGTGSRLAPSAHCFHQRGSMPELPPWLQHCYSTSQMPNSEGTQQASQYFHQSAAYLTHEGSLVQTDRSLKSNAGVGRLDAAAAAASSTGIGGLSSGDMCDSNTFLTYVLNQQRSSGIFLFDPIRSLHSNESTSEMTLHQHENSANSDSAQQQTLDPKVANDDSIKSNAPPSAIPPVEGNPTHRDAATNTVLKYSQNLSPSHLHVDAKTNTGDYSDDSDAPGTPKQSSTCCQVHQCKRCVASKLMHTCHEGTGHNFSSNFTTDASCQKVSNVRNYSIMGCSNHRPEMKRTNVVVVSTSGCSQQCTCLNDSSRVPGQSVKVENMSNHSFSGTDNGKFSNLQLVQSPGGTECKCVNDCGNACVKDNRRMHYVDVDRPFTCEICLKNYHTSTALMNHMRYHRGQRPYQCEVCNKAFATNSHLVTHRRVHTGERPFQCRLCRRSFADRSAYVKHERTHGPNGTIIKRYKCEECGNAFVDSCGLKKHVRIHTGERPYCCSVCQKTFSTSSTFVAHKRIHSGERPYKCENCDKMFITKSHLLTHRRTHTGEKPFNCQVCNRAFADGSSFRRHERLHTGENRHTCDICGKGFPFDTSLAKHKQSHIPGTPTYVYMV